MPQNNKESTVHLLELPSFPHLGLRVDGQEAVGVETSQLRSDGRRFARHRLAPGEARQRALQEAHEHAELAREQGGRKREMGLERGGRKREMG